MKVTKAVEFMKKYTNCPECGNHFIGNGQGTCVVDDDSFTRTCKCGWSIVVKDGEE